MQRLVFCSLHAFFKHSPLNSSYWWVIPHWSLTVSITLLIGHFQLEHFISKFVMKLKVFRIWAYLDSRLWLICLMVRVGPVPGHSDPPPLSQHCQQNETDWRLSPGLGYGIRIGSGKECWMPGFINPIIIRSTSSLPPLTWCIVVSLKKARIFLAEVIRLQAFCTWYSSPLSHSLPSYLSTSGEKLTR